ncbi:MAG: nucleotidyltransferase family protein [Candidatus Omnitrophota bacterium]
MDWEKFKALIAYHELYPFVYAAIKKSAWPISGDLEKFLDHHYYLTLMRAQNFWQEFLTIAEAFRAEKATMAPIKGISSLADIYRDKPFRPMADIDILVKEEEFTKARGILSNLGYEADLGDLREEYWLKKHCELTFSKKKQNRSGVVDVHFRLDAKRSNAFILPHLWERTREISMDGHTVRLLSQEDQLFCLALHQRRFGGKGFCLKNVFDLAMTLEKFGNAFDWDYVIREAQAWKMRAAVFFILFQAKSLFDATVPESVWKRMNIPYYQRGMTVKLIEKYALPSRSSDKNKELYLKMQFILFDGFLETIGNLVNIPLEQFAKFYGLRPYEKKTEFFYRFRFFYIPIAFLCKKNRR